MAERLPERVSDGPTPDSPAVEIRPLAVEDRRAAANAIRAALLNPPSSDEALERGRASVEASDALAAWDGDRCVGHVAAFRFEMTVPGGARVPTAGVTRVGVVATHTRRGLLREMMERLLAESLERGQAIAALLASEAPIYGRFGFGHATDHVVMHVDAARARPLRGTPIAGTMRILGRAEADVVVPEIYERCLADRPGRMTREDWLWQWELANVSKPTSQQHARGEYVAVHTDPSGVDDGYVRYEAGWHEDVGDGPTASGVLHELIGTDATAERALWDYLLDIDLVRTWTAERRPADEPIRRAFRDVRAYATRRRIDELWIRLLDVDAALGTRTYGPAQGRVAIGVVDPLVDANDGVWTVSADGAERGGTEADLTVDVAALSAAYLGGVSWRQLTDAGEIRGAFDPNLIDRLDALFAVRPAPHCGTEF